MSEEKGDKTGAPEQPEYEGKNLTEDSSQTEPGGEEVRDITVDHVMNLERGNMMDNFIPLGGPTCDITIDQGKMEAEIGVGKKGTALIVGSNHKFTIQSRYLSSSPVGSCHDSCKARYKRESMTKASPVSEMIRRARLTKTQSDLSKSAPKEETKKKTVLRQLSLPSSIEEEGEEEEEEGGVASVELNCSKKDVKNSKVARLRSEIKPSSILSPRQASKRKSEIQPSKKVVVRNLNLLESSSLGIKTIKTRKEKGIRSMSEKEKGKEPTKISYLSPKTLVKKSPSMKARLYRNTKSFSNPRKLSSYKEAQIDGVGDVPEKTLYMIEPNTENKPGKRASRFSLSNENLSSTSRGSRVSKGNDSKASQKGKCAMKEQFQLGEDQPESDSVNTKQIDTITEDGASSTLIAESPVGGGRSKSNTPRVAKSAEEHEGSKRNSLGAKSMKGHGCSKPSSTMGDGGSKPSTPRTKSTLERKMKAKGKVSGSEGNDSPTWKVKFKKGTVVALQTSDGSPKKLLFKRGRILGDDQITKDEAVRILNRDRGGDEQSGSKQSESRRIRLRHQEALSRKEIVDLNIVIEETVSQLVKTRKSKVKALVGAFETVMSLRDSKAMAETSAF